MPPRLALHFLGSPQLYLDHEPITADRRKAVALLAYLAVEAGKQTRDSLSALLWPDFDQSKAFANLRHTLWEVQQSIGEGWLLADRETIGLSEDADLLLDVREFESLFAQIQIADDVSRRIALLSDAVKLYRNHFLTGFSLKDAPDFNEWAFTKSEDLRQRLSSVLVMLSNDHIALGQADQAIPYARRLITLDPLNEFSHRHLMNIYIQAGQYSAALKQYQACEQLLRRELGVDPQPETRELYKKIRKREVKPVKAQEQKETDKPPHNIPLQLSSYIGREKEQKAVAKLVASNRLVTLIGTGGIGKTRMSLKVGEQLLDKFVNGVWFVELASLNDPVLVPQAVATVFGIMERSENSLTEKLVRMLHAKTALIILDNCEHLLDACAQLTESLLKNCPSLKMLATSREGLGIPGESLYRVPSLSIPKVDKNIEHLAEYESIQLFTERARLSVSDFSLTTENIPPIVQICRRLDGIPLAIELAAARVDMLSTEQIAARLDESFNLLASSSRTRLPRQQTLQASIEWSWRLLSDMERSFLQRLSIFAGGWTLEAAESICSREGIEIDQVLDLMTRLVMKSLVVADQELGREKRYHLLEMIRQYANERLAESGEEEKIRSKHLEYFLRLSEKLESGLIGPQQAEWVTRTKDEQDNLRAALQRASEKNVEAGLYISGRLKEFWESFNMREGAHWLAEFLQKIESKEYPYARARALHTYGWLLTWFQQFKQAQLIAEECLELFRACKAVEGEIDALLLLGNTIEFQDGPLPAAGFYQQALALSQSLGDSWRAGYAHFYLGWDRSDSARSFGHFEKAMKFLREVGDWGALANVLGVLGTFRVLHGDIDLAQTYLDEAARLWRSNKKADVWENAKVAKSQIALMNGDYDQAHKLLQETLLGAEASGNRMSYIWTRARQGRIHLHEGNLVEARTIFAEAIIEFQKDGNTNGVMFGVEGVAKLLVTTGKPEIAAQLIGWTDVTREQLRDIRPLIEDADMYRNMSAIIAKIGPSAFEVAYDDGRAMTIDETVRLALGEGGKK